MSVWEHLTSGPVTAGKIMTWLFVVLFVLLIVAVLWPRKR